MSQHTPGPWTQSTALSSDWPFIRYIDDANGDCVAHVRSGMKANDPPVFSQAEALANARLIIEAPSMLQVIRDALAASDANDGDSLMNAIAAFRPILARIDK